MKRIALLLFAGFAALWSCETVEEGGGKVPEQEKGSIALSRSTISFNADGDVSDTLQIFTEGEWTVSGYGEGTKTWLGLSAESGNGNAVITLSCTAFNPYDEERLAVLTFTSENATAFLLIKQAADPTRRISISKDSLMLNPAIGSEDTVMIVCSKPWALEGYTEEMQEWLSISPISGEGDAEVIIRSLKINEETEIRNATVGFRLDRVHAVELTISQECGLELSATPSSISFSPSAGDSKTLSIMSNAVTKDWRIEGINAEVAGWFTFSATSGRGNAEVEITTLADNSGAFRNAALRVVLDERHVVDFSLVQTSNLEIDATPEALVFSCKAASSKQVIVTASTDEVSWVLEGYTDEVKTWLNVDTESYAGLEKAVTISTLGANATYDNREAVLRFAFPGGVYKEVAVTQLGIQKRTITVDLTDQLLTDHPDINKFGSLNLSCDRVSASDPTKTAAGTSKKKTEVFITESGIQFSIWATGGYAKNTTGGGKFTGIFFNHYNAKWSNGGVTDWIVGSQNGYAWFKIPAMEYGVLTGMDVKMLSKGLGPVNIARSVDPDTGAAITADVVYGIPNLTASNTVYNINLPGEEANRAYYIVMGDSYGYLISFLNLYYDVYE